jgi:hypothetical protein
MTLGNLDSGNVFEPRTGRDGMAFLCDRLVSWNGFGRFHFAITRSANEACTLLFFQDSHTLQLLTMAWTMRFDIVLFCVIGGLLTICTAIARTK